MEQTLPLQKIVIEEQPDGNWIGTYTRNRTTPPGEVEPITVTARTENPQTVLLELITKDYGTPKH